VQAMLDMMIIVRAIKKMFEGMIFIYTSQEMLDLKVTPEMEKSMHQFHGMGYKEYSRDHKKRMQVEKKREEDYAKSQSIIANI
jgi:hypothetical protein